MAALDRTGSLPVRLENSPASLSQFLAVILQTGENRKRVGDSVAAKFNRVMIAGRSLLGCTGE
jgi:hypothetical protein